MQDYLEQQLTVKNKQFYVIMKNLQLIDFQSIDL